MHANILIRNETPDDLRAITEVTIAAFKTLEISGHTEHFIVEALRAARALPVSLVAVRDGQVVGHIAFSPVTMSDGTPHWYGLGPVSVLPEHQRKGIGQALIKEGLARLKDLKARGCCLVGHPGYYRKFGFENAPGLGLEGVPPEVFFALSFDGPVPQGTVAFHEAFRADGRPAAAVENATAKFLAGYNCAQAVLHAHSDRLQVDPSLALRLATGFGAGMGREGEICGAVSGAILAISLRHGRGEGDDKARTEETYTRTRELLARFKERHGSVLCRDLIHCDLRTADGQRYFKENDLLHKTCVGCVQTATELAG
jgi:putative acetyltransferase